MPPKADLGSLRALRLRALTEDPTAFGSTPESELARTDEQWAFRFDPGATFAAVDGTTFAGMVTGLPDPGGDRRRGEQDAAGAGSGPRCGAVELADLPVVG